MTSSSSLHPFAFPKAAAFGRILPKNKIYENSSVSAAIKKQFIKDVEKIIWSYKLSPETTNLPVKNSVQEIQVLTIILKNGSLKHDVLMAIDKAIPSPILFVLVFEGKVRYVAAYKRPSEADRSKWVISSYFETKYFPDDTKKAAMPIALDLEALYQALLETIIPFPLRKNETLYELVARMERIKIKENEAVRLSSRLKKEKQFNRKVEINAELRKLKKEVEELEK